MLTEKHLFINKHIIPGSNINSLRKLYTPIHFIQNFKTPLIQNISQHNCVLKRPKRSKHSHQALNAFLIFSKASNHPLKAKIPSILRKSSRKKSNSMKEICKCTKPKPIHYFIRKLKAKEKQDKELRKTCIKGKIILLKEHKQLQTHRSHKSIDIHKPKKEVIKVNKSRCSKS